MTHPLHAQVMAHAPPALGAPLIEVERLCKRYGAVLVHENLDLEIRRGEIVSIVGGSGAGKTTLVRQMLGLERPSSGTVRVFGEDIFTGAAGALGRMRRRSGILFQHGALFSSMSVFDNIAQPFRELGRVPEDLLRDVVMLKLEMVGLSPRDAVKQPAALSGGMIKRVGIARAIALEPELLFLDEPTAGLDPAASEEFVELLATLHRALELTVVMITHDLDTMTALSSRVAMLAERRVLVAAPLERVVEVEHPFIDEYFLGERGLRALQGLAPERRASLPPRARPPS